MAETTPRITRHEVVDPRTLTPNPANWRRHPTAQVKALRESLRLFGFAGSLLFNERTGRLVNGHARLELALEAGLEAVPVDVGDWSPEEELELLAVYDPISGMAESDIAALMAISQDVGEALGRDSSTLAELLASLMPAAKKVGLTDPDEVPPVPEEPITKPGDLWLLGEHRLLCGDALQVEDVALLMAGAKANMVFTDPPYGVNIVSRVGNTGRANADARQHAGAVGIQNDDLSLAELTAFLDAAFANTLEATQPGAAWYVTAPHNPIGLAFALALTKIDVWKHSLVWVKSSLVLGRADYHYRHEPIYYGWSPGAAHHAIVDRTEDTVWSIPRPLRSLEHPTMKPVELIERAIRNSTEAGAVVLDTFVGSGSTLIAAERLARRAYAMEIDPHYVDVAVRRWEQFTGQTAILAATRNAPEGALSAVPAAA